MCLTEAHAGTDLGLIRTRAEPQADGSYAITGSKIFITGGDQDLTETSCTWCWPSCRMAGPKRHLAVSGAESAGQCRRLLAPAMP
jgi:alkylation response protein AidB-like acyl-CoA dehydrogenase